MHISDSLAQYKQELIDVIHKYAYENYHMPPLIEQVDVEWVQEIFDVSNINKELHEDLIFDLKDMGLYDKIVAECDKFVILPDVMSQSPTPIRFDRNEYDINARNIVIINGKVWELFESSMHYYYYNHNGKFYVFYKDETSNGVFELVPSKVSVIYFYDYSFLFTDISDNYWEQAPGMYKFTVDENNHITEEPVVPKVGVGVMSPYMLFDYENAVDDTVYPEIPGLMSIGKDSWIQEHAFNVNYNQVFIHNEGVLFSNTALIIYDDGTYWIDNTYAFDQGRVLTKIDKHTIRLDKDENISKIIVFLRPFEYTDYIHVDSLYYRAHQENEQAFLALRPYRKVTNDLLHKMMSQDVTLDYLVDYGYSMDLDVLKTIQNYFSTIDRLNIFTNISVEDDLDLFNLHPIRPKIVFRTRNKLGYYPVLFINDIMYPADYKILKHGDTDLIVIDPEFFVKWLDPEGTMRTTKWQRKNTSRSSVLPPYTPPDDIVDNLADKEWLLNFTRTLVDKATVCYSEYGSLDADNYSKQGGKIYRKSLHKGEIFLDYYGEHADKNEFKGHMFVNGYFANEYTDDTLFRWFDGINLFDMGDLDFDMSRYTNPPDSELYIPGSSPNYYISDLRTEQPVLIKEDTVKFYAVIEDNREIFIEHNPQVLINRCDKYVWTIARPYFSMSKTTWTFDNSVKDIQMVNINMKEQSTLVFDKFGKLCIDDTFILSKTYIDIDRMYNYKHVREVSDDVILHIIPLKLADYVRDWSLEIDETKIGHLNKGSFNDNAMEDRNVRELFLPNEPEAIRDVPHRWKQNKDMMAHKILTRYWLSCKGDPYDKTRFTQELAGIDLEALKASYADFIAEDEYRSPNCLNSRIIGSRLLNRMFLDSGLKYMITSGVCIDSDETYRVDVDEIEKHYTRKGLHIDNITNITK